MLALFSDAVENHGLPSRIRTDLGGENVEVWRYMVEQHASRHAVITGSSTHNERIERLWRDVHRCVGVVFADTFHALEADDHLDCLNEVDLYCLHLVFLPRINSVLTQFVESWNDHSLSSTHNLTPNQLFICGAIKQNMMPQQPEITSSAHASGHPAASDHVRVPRNRFQPCNTLLTLLSTFDRLGPSDDFGCDIYL